MTDTAKEIFRLASEGYCCSQIMVQMGLEARGDDENPELLNAVAGLCGGLHVGLCCGILTGAACLLSLYDKQKAAMFMIPPLVDWFKATYAKSYGGIECEVILAGDPSNRMSRCPNMMEETVIKCRELLSNYGYTL